MSVPPALTLEAFSGNTSEFGRDLVHVPAWKYAVLILLFLGFPKFLSAEIGIIRTYRSGPALHFKPFPIHQSSYI